MGIVEFFQDQNAAVLRYMFEEERDYDEWKKTTKSTDKSRRRFLEDREEQRDAEFRAKYGYDPPRNGWD